MNRQESNILRVSAGNLDFKKVRKYFTSIRIISLQFNYWISAKSFCLV